MCDQNAANSFAQLKLKARHPNVQIIIIEIETNNNYEFVKYVKDKKKTNFS